MESSSPATSNPRLGPRAPGSLALSPTQQLAVGMAVLLLALLPVSRGPTLPTRDDRTDPRPPGAALLYADSLELNAAAEADLETLPLIGPARAEAIVRARERRGGFCVLEEARRAARMGSREWTKVVVHLTVTPPPRCLSSGPG